jgi:glycosyltransferase involved in cell wall biosynthesis
MLPTSSEFVQGKVTYSLVIPVYKNLATLPKLLEKISQLASQLPEKMEVVFVVDGSPDESYKYLQAELPKISTSSQLISLSRNFGAFEAIKCGLGVAAGKYISVMSADLQEPIELIRTFFEKLSDGGCYVVLGSRESRVDPWVSKILSNSYWYLYRRFVQPEMPKGGVDVFGLTAEARDQVVQATESNTSLVGFLLWIGFRRDEVGYSRLARESGPSSWTAKKKFEYFTNSVFSFSSLPISTILFVGAFGTLATFGVAVTVFLTWLTSGIPVPGYTTQILVQLFSTGSLLFAVGVVGTYTWRTYENSKKRPGSIIMSRHNFGE